MKPKIVKLEIKDNEIHDVLETYYLVNPDKNKLAELKRDIEERFNYDGLDDEDIEAKEEFCDDIWNCIGCFIQNNFVVLDIDATYEISY